MIQDLKNDSALWERERRSRAHMQGLPEGFDSNTLYPGAAHAPGYNDYSTAGPVHQSYSYHEPASHDPGAGVPAANASTSHVAEPMEQYDTYNRKLSVVAATTRYLQTRERRYLPMVLNGRAIYALPDTGVESNVLEEQYAISTGAIIDRSARRVFKNARSRTFSSVGTAVLELSFHSYPEDRWTCSFDVVKNLAVPVVLGARLLEQTRVLKEYAHLFTKKALYLMLNLGNPNKKIWRFMWMQSPRKQLPCLLGERPAVVDLDTGSDIDVVSLEWAEFRRWRIMPVPEDEDTVMVANGELHRLQGFVDVVLSMGPGFAGVEKRLYVMDGLSSDAVLGDPTIESLDLFGKFGGLLIDLHLPEESDAFNNIVWIKKAGKVGEIDQTVERLLAADAAGAPGPSSDNTKKKKSRLGRRSTTLDNDGKWQSAESGMPKGEGGVMLTCNVQLSSKN